MRIELTFPGSRRETTDLKSGTGTSSVTSPLSKKIIRERRPDGKQIQQTSVLRRGVSGRRFYACAVVDKLYDFLYLGRALIVMFIASF